MYIFLLVKQKYNAIDPKTRPMNKKSIKFLICPLLNLNLATQDESQIKTLLY
jgi:hypothetical protein